MSSSNGNRGRAVRAPHLMPPLEQVLRKRRILITGATGFLGKVLLMLLLRWHPEIERIYLLIRGDRRSSLGRLRREILDSPAMAPLREHLGARFDRYVEERVVVVPGDISDPDLTQAPELIQDATLDAVIHCAGLINFEASLEKALEANTMGAANVIEFCRKRSAALVHVSSCYGAGVADGQRFEDDIPVDWCPTGRRNFNLQREIKDALAQVARVEAESHDQSHHEELRARHEPESGAEEPAGRESVSEARRKQWVEERLKQVGRERAQSWGWPNTYSYTKSLGEQLALAAHDSLEVTVVRPSVIESALKDPFPGWNQGVNTSAPLTYLAGRGYRFYPATGDLVLDVIPVDLVAHALIPILAALLLRRHQAIYQLCTSDRNPFTMRRLVELTALSNRRENRGGNGPLGLLGPHLEAVVVSKGTYELMSGTLPSLLKQGADFARTLAGDRSMTMRKISRQIDSIFETTAMAREMVEVYRPFIQDLVYTFHSANTRALYTTLTPADAACHPYHPEKIDWNDYWVNVHLPGLRRHIFPQLDFHTRSRPHGPGRFRTLVDLLDRAAQRYGARPALTARMPSGQSTAITYRELRDSAHRAALMLGSRGVKPGDRVLLIGENSPQWVLAYFAILCAGAVAVPLDHLITAEELAPICKIAEPRCALVSAACGERLAGDIRVARRAIPQLEFGELQRPFIMPAKSDAPAQIERKSLASIVFTSGTTGDPKGVMLTHGNFAAEVGMLGRVFALGGNDVLLSLLPLHHTFEFTCGMLLPLASGAQIVHPIGVSPASLSRTLADVRPTALIGVPALWEAIHRRIVDEVEERGPFFHATFDRLRDLNRQVDAGLKINLGAMLFRQAHAALGGRLRLAISGGAALPQRVTSFFNDIGIRLLEGYGLTEAAPVLSTARPDDPLKIGSVGKPLGGVEIRLDAPDGGDVGEIVARGANVMTGYYRNQAATEAVLREGWLHTGDLGRLDLEGRLYIVGRAKDVIVDSGGNNIYIDELEEAYGHSPHIKEIAVVGLKVAQGEQPAALVVPAYARSESRRTVEDNLRQHFQKVSAGLNPHKRIRILRFTDAELPRTRTRKVKRAEVAAMLRRMVESDAGTKAAVSAEIEPWLAQSLTQVASGSIEIMPATRLIEDLGLDSLALAELAEQVAIHIGHDLSPEELSNVRTVDDLQRLISTGPTRPRLPSYARLAEPYTPALPAPLKRLAERAVLRAQRAAIESWLTPGIMGRGNIPANRNVLVVANHASHLDFGLITYALGEMGHRLVVLAAKDYFFNSALRRFVVQNFTRLIPFDRERAQLESLDEALAELAGGRSVLMFPEGTRSPDGAVHEFKSGAGYLALRSGCDVLPVLVRGSHAVLGKGSLIPRRHPVDVRIGRVIANGQLRALAEDGEGAYRKVADYIHRAVIGLGERLARATRDGKSAVGVGTPPGQTSSGKKARGGGRAKHHAKA